VAPSDQASIGGDFGQSELRPETRAEGSERLAHFKAPRSVEFVEKLPRTETGKLPNASCSRPTARPFAKTHPQSASPPLRPAGDVDWALGAV
jgi:hypothetical protein